MYYEKIVSKENNEWILLIHGLGGSTKTWKYQIESFSKKYNLLLIDLDGHGNSDTPLYKKYRPKMVVHEIFEILNKENIDRVNIVSLSLGTLVAFEMAGLYPDKIKSIVFAGNIINLDNKRKFLLNFVNNIKNVFPHNKLYNLFACVIMPKNNHKKSRDIFIREAKKINKKAFYNWIDSMNVYRNRFKKYIEFLNDAEFPFLFISGEEDYMFLKGTKNLEKQIKNFKLNIIEKCGHVCSIEQHEIFNFMVLDFLNFRGIEFGKNTI